MFDRTLIASAQELVTTCTQRGLRVVTAESCTGGMVAALITEIPGSSAMFERGFVVYANEAKVSNLGVAPVLLHRHGAVSAEVARAMAAGAILHSASDISVAITGIAGPSGGSPLKPVGLIYIATCQRGKLPEAHEFHFAGERGAIRMQAVAAAIDLLKEQIA